MNQYHSIAIDGPSGAGKSTLARALAREMGYLYVDTGAIYRTVGLAVQRRGLDPQDPQAVEQVLGQVDITMGYGEDGQQRMYLDGEDVSQAIRQHVISRYASQVAALAPVRAFLLNKQRHLAENHNVIMDGRDIGTVVLPQADVKIFLTADPEDRARRRYLELLERGQQADLEQILADVVERDRQDMERAIAPLKKAEDATVVDTTGKDLEESRKLLLEAIRSKLGAGEVHP
ncbi:MAG TPA: (d)CMP kinase [Candidatus Enterenecus avicola]|nr:(d)CMP kinase [Candidatus Enterenecus avicola]